MVDTEKLFDLLDKYDEAEKRYEDAPRPDMCEISDRWMEQEEAEKQYEGAKIDLIDELRKLRKAAQCQP